MNKQQFMLLLERLDRIIYLLEEEEEEEATPDDLFYRVLEDLKHPVFLSSEDVAQEKLRRQYVV